MTILESPTHDLILLVAALGQPASGLRQIDQLGLGSRPVPDHSDSDYEVIGDEYFGAPFRNWATGYTRAKASIRCS